MATKKSEATMVTIPAINIRTFTMKIVGDSPLIMHKFSEKAKKEILDKQQKKASAGRETKNPVADFIRSMHWLEGEPVEKTEKGFEKAIKNGAKFGFPANGLKESAVSAGYRADVTPDKVTAYGAFHINGEFVEIKAIPEMREDHVKIGKGTADIRYRGEFKNWHSVFEVRYNANAYSKEQIINLFNLGGFAVGIGEMRPEKGGQYGMYHVE